MPRLSLADKQKIVAGKTRKLRAKAAGGKAPSAKDKQLLASRAGSMMRTATRQVRSS